MIRDPSDGSVREERRAEKQGGAQKMGARCSGSTSVSKTEGDGSIPSASASGLAPDHSNRAKRLQESRDWLQNYHQEKSHARRGNNLEQENP